MAKAALTCRRVRHMTDGLSPLFVMPNESHCVYVKNIYLKLIVKNYRRCKNNGTYCWCRLT